MDAVLDAVLFVLIDVLAVLVSALDAVLLVLDDGLAVPVPALFSFVFLLPLLCILRSWRGLLRYGIRWLRITDF